jgi:hypothetical protein
VKPWTVSKRPTIKDMQTLIFEGSGDFAQERHVSDPKSGRNLAADSDQVRSDRL